MLVRLEDGDGKVPFLLRSVLQFHRPAALTSYLQEPEKEPGDCQQPADILKCRRDI